MRRYLSAHLLLPLFLTACPMMDDDDGDDEGSTSAPSVSGVARVSAPLAAGRDGIGTLYIAARLECSLEAEVIGGAVIPDADLSDPSLSEAFSIMDLPEGTVHLAAFLDDDENADPMAPIPSPGDPVFADGVGDGILSCVEAEVGDDDVEIEMAAVVPLLSVGGTVHRLAAAEIAEDGDGVGTLVVAAFADCALDAELLGAAIIPDADVSDPSNKVPFEIPDIPAETVQLAYFVDDNGDADPVTPLPGPGDILYAEGVGDGVLSCIEASAGDLELELPLTATIPLP